MGEPMDFVDLAERITISGILLVILVWVAKHWLEPVIKSHLDLVERLNASIQSNEKVQANQTRLLEEIAKEREACDARLHRIEQFMDKR